MTRKDFYAYEWACGALVIYMVLWVLSTVMVCYTGFKPIFVTLWLHPIEPIIMGSIIVEVLSRKIKGEAK